MGLLDIIKRKLGFGPKMLMSGEGEIAEVATNSNSSNLRSRIDVRKLMGIFEQYETLTKDLKDLDGKDDEYVAQFYDCIIEIFDKGPEYSQDRLTELEKRLVEIRKQEKIIAKNVSARGELYFMNSVYQDKQREEFSVVGEMINIRNVINSCLGQMEEDYSQNEKKYEGAKELLSKGVTYNNEIRTKSSSLLAIEYALLSRVFGQGVLAPEQINIIESEFGRQLISKDIQTFVGKRMSMIEETIKGATSTLTEIQEGNQIDDGRKFSKLEFMVNGITDKDVRESFESVKNKTLEGLPKEIDIESVIKLYNIDKQKEREDTKDRNDNDITLGD